MQIRQAVPADAPAMVEIERRSFGDPWSEVSFREALTAVWSFGLVAETPSGIVGYLIGREVAGTGEILNLAVDPGTRRRGFARRLLGAGLTALRRRGATEVYLEVRVSNVGAQTLYVDAGFVPIGERGDYYRSPREDALVLRLDMGSNDKSVPTA